MKELLEQIYGKKLIKYIDGHYSLPLYLSDGRQMYDVQISDREFVIVYIMDMERFHIKVLKKQIVSYRNSMDSYVVYGFDKISTFQRRSLIENDIPFISRNGQMYLPFMGVYFDRCCKRVDEIRTQFMPVTQILFLLFLYDKKTYTKSEAAARLGINPMSVTRASKQLTECGLIHEDKTGTEVLMTADYSDRIDYFERARPFLIDPVQSDLFVTDRDQEWNMPAAGEYALSLRTDLGYPEYYEYAVFKNDPAVKDIVGIDPALEAADDLIRIQKWKYDPLLFSRDDQIDPVSLICSLGETNDDRVNKCLEQVRGEIKKWRITKR
ncbi:hypothetical protein SAMN02910456_01124 [Ruminococcaceae bacterium YRB3002]|nr:hypothetical protein SAMN02910456_01124 [Ruminococcaceae bacterium YRB3002]